MMSDIMIRMRYAFLIIKELKITVVPGMWNQDSMLVEVEEEFHL
jgi:hypothetical protein